MTPAEPPASEQQLPDAGPSREALLVQVEALRSLVERQQRFIGGMRASRFWRIRDAVFAFLKRRGIPDPLPVPTTAELETAATALGDPYQLFRARLRRSAAEADDMAALARRSSVTIPIEVNVYAAPGHDDALERTLASLRDQWYPHWNANVVGPASAPSLAGTAVVLLDAGDTLEPDALLWVAIAFDEGADIVYTDHDVFDAAGIPAQPCFKPDWSPETLLTRNYVAQLCAFRSVVVRAVVGGDASARPELYDLLLRASERTEKIVHVARALCHLRVAPLPPPLATVREALARRGEDADGVAVPFGIDVRFHAPADERVVIVIPTRDHAELLERCLTSVFERTTHSAFSVIVVDNASSEAATRDLFARWEVSRPGRFRVLRDVGPFNYSRLNNLAVAASDEPYIVLLNNDTEVIEPDWLGRMLGQARRPAIGAVGALLLYPDGSVQHAGVMLGGVLALAGHAYRNSDPRAPIPALHLDTNYLAVTGACLMTSRRKFDEVGGLDESLHVSYNDVDYCLRLHARGYRNVVVPGARLYHFESRSRGADDSAAKVARAAREAALIVERWPALAARDPYYNPNLTLRAEDFSLRL